MNAFSGFLHATFGYWAAGGPLLIPIALASFAVWLLVLRSNRELSETMEHGLALENAAEEWPDFVSAQELQRRVSTFPGSIPALVSAAVADILHGIPPTRAFSEQAAPFAAHFRRNFILVGALTSLAPLLGLLGTVTGMIETFDAVSATSDDPGGKVAAGISKALITTQFGLVVSMPGIFGLTHLHKLMNGVEEVLANCKTKTLCSLNRDDIRP